MNKATRFGKNTIDMRNIIKKVIIGLLAGIISGLFSTGGGMIVVPAFIYLLNMEDIAIKYSFSRSTATRMDNKALLEFADKFLFSQLMNQVSPVIDLHVYQ